MSGSFKKTAFTVMIFSVITRIIAFLFKIYLSRAVGAEELGLFQIGMSVWTLFVTVCASGLSVTVSRRTAELLALNQPKRIGGAVSAALLIGMTITIVVVIIYSVGSAGFAKLFTDSRASVLFRILLPALISTCGYNILRAYIMGRKSYVLYSVTELAEEILNVIGVVIILSGVFGAISGGLAISISFTVCDVICFLIMLVVFFKSEGTLTAPKGEIKKMAVGSTPITLMRIIAGLAMSITAIVLPMRLVASGLSTAEATAEFGRAVGMAYPLLFAPLAITSSLSVVLLPEVAALFAKKDYKSIAAKSDSAFGFVTLITMLFFVLYASLGEDIGRILFNEPRAGKFLSVASGMVLPVAMAQLTTTILNSMGKERICFINNIIAVVVMSLCIYFLPQFIGIYSLAVAQILCHIIMFILNCIILVRAKAANLDYYKPLVITGIFSLVMIALVRLAYAPLCTVMSQNLTAILLGALVSILYVCFLQVFKLFDVIGFVSGFGKKLKFHFSKRRGKHITKAIVKQKNS